MKKKSNKNRLSLDKETIAHLNLEQLLSEQANEVQGGAVTAFTACGASCWYGNPYTSCQ